MVCTQLDISQSCAHALDMASQFLKDLQMQIWQDILMVEGLLQDIYLLFQGELSHGSLSCRSVVLCPQWKLNTLQQMKPERKCYFAVHYT